MAKEKIQTNIYRIDTSSFEPNLNCSQIIEKIIHNFNKNIEKTVELSSKVEEKSFIASNINEKTDFHGFSVEVFSNKNENPPAWQSFLRPVLDENETLLKIQNLYHSYIAFFIKDEYLFAICGGLGNFAIQNYTDQNFGIEIISRILNKDILIKSTQERSFVGNILSSTNFFKGDFKLSDEDDFGKIYKSIQTNLNTSVLTQIFDFKGKDLKRDCGCVAKTSFQINKLITFDKLLEILDRLIFILNKDQNFEINKIKLISKRGVKNKKLIKELNNKIETMLFDSYISGNNLDFDFFNKDIAKYFTATDYQLFKGNIELQGTDFSDFKDINKLLEYLRINNLIKSSTLEEFSDDVNKFKIKTFDQDGYLNTDSKIINNLHGEIKINNQTYFLVDEDWYLLEQEFITDLNEDCKIILKNQNPIKLDNFNLGNSEDLYNQSYVRDGYLVLHRILDNNIELCDILKIDGNKSYLIHVKKGFDNSIRELTSQVYIAAKRIQQAKASNDVELFKNLYRNLTSYKGNDSYLKKVSSQKVSEQEFVNFFMENELHFCLAFIDTAKGKRHVEDEIESFDSNIAKFSIIELYKKMTLSSINLQIIQIDTE